MARNGAGTYQRIAGTPYAYDTVIDETIVNSEFDDIATALTQSLAKDGQTVPTANIPMGGYKLTGLGDATVGTDALALGQMTADDGSALVGFLQSGTGATARTVQSKERFIVSVEDFGGAADDATDNASAFQKAQAALPNGGIIWLENVGTYRKSGTHRLRRELTIKGKGMSRSVIVQTSDETAFAMNETTDGALVRNVAFEDLSIAKQTETATTGISAIKLEGTSNNVWGARIRNVSVSDFYDGIYIARPILTEIENVDSSSNVRHGIHCVGSGTSLKLKNNFCRVNGGNGYNIAGSFQYTTLDTNAADQNTGHGYYIGDTGSNYPVGVTLLGNGAESNGGDGFQFENVENLAAIGCFAYLNTANGFNTPGVRGASFIGCKGQQNSQWGLKTATSASPKVPSTITSVGCTWASNTSGRISDLTVISDIASPDTNTFDYNRAIDAALGFAIAGTTVLDSGRVLQNLGFGSHTLHWYKVSLTYADFAAAALTGDYTFPNAIPDGSYVTDCVFQLTQEFSGGAVASATFAVGDAGSGTYSNWLPATNVFTGAGTGYKDTNVTDRGTRLYDATNKALRMPVFGSTRAFKARITTTGANTNALTAGAVTVWVGWMKLP